MYRILIFLAIVLVAVGKTSAQTTNPDSLFWVVETNIYNRSYTIVRFYNSREVMVHEVRLQGVYVDVGNLRHRRKLEMIVKEYYDRVVTSLKETSSMDTIQVSKRLLSGRGQF